ncbi:winged helix-turn-helix transcriptional regulator [Candidatus Sumerlaeota bacterium]|nr:winged helix-turn-helix transcriptional regulator [Candidatus Sumerlaeota bacterium]
MNEIFKALADPSRRKILELLWRGDMSAGEIASYFPISKPSLSRHFAVLKGAGLIQGNKNGATILYRLNISALEYAVQDFMSKLKIEQKEKGIDEH